MAASVLATLTIGCGGDPVGPEFEPIRNGAIYTYIGDTPACDLLSFRMNISGLKFRRSNDSESFAEIFPTASLLVSLKMDFAALRDYSTIMYLSTMPVDSYDRVDLDLRFPQMVLYDPSEDPSDSRRRWGAFHIDALDPTAFRLRDCSVSNQRPAA